MPSFVIIITFSSGIYMATSSSKGHAFQSKSEQVFEKRSLYLEWQVLVLTDYSNLASSFPKMNKLCLSKSAKRFLFDCLYYVILRMFFFVVNVCSHSAGQATLLFLPLVQLGLTFLLFDLSHEIRAQIPLTKQHTSNHQKLIYFT